jgi:hypothetical protein
MSFHNFPSKFFLFLSECLHVFDPNVFEGKIIDEKFPPNTLLLFYSRTVEK